MITKLTRIGDDVAVVLDTSILAELGWDVNTEVELSTNGKNLVVMPARDERFKNAADKINRKHAGLFKRLGE